MLTRSQRYARDVYRQIKDDVSPRAEVWRTKYGSMAHKLPVLIRTAGLAQALAFVEARGSDEHKALLDHLAAVVGEESRCTLIERSRNAKIMDYMLLTRQVLDALIWFKRFAQSVLHVDAEAQTEGDLAL